ncbi:hypothetical protein F5Y10DRAFT_262393 [Nemania abortiva]|nr:hypothetical protein F5Y10DRAFT_262393 [Nemania abortiva]
MTDQEISEGRKAIDFGYKTRDDPWAKFVGSSDMLVNPGIWAPDWNEMLAAHKRTLKRTPVSPTQSNMTYDANANTMGLPLVPFVEEPTPKLWDTPETVMTDITLPDQYDSIFSIATPPATNVHHRKGSQGSPALSYLTGYPPVINPNTTIIQRPIRPYARERMQSPKVRTIRAGSGYQGNPTLTLNKPAPIDESENVRFWVTGLPPDITATELLGGIRGVGSVFAINLVKPQPPEGVDDKRQRVRTAAASITFFSVKAGNAFMAKTLRFGEHEAVIRRNRILTAPMPRDGRSRVIVIEGDSGLVNPESLELLAESWGIRYITDSITYTSIGEKRNRVFWAFGSFRAQAHAVYLRIRTELAGEVYVRYGTDPCAAFEKRTPPHRRMTQFHRICRSSFGSSTVV